MKSKKNGFTLVELLAVIVILAIILVIAVPKIMNVIEDSKKATLESTAKMIASQAEKQKVQNTVLGKDEEITCKSVAKLNDIDYASCSIKFNGSNEAKVTIEGSGKFSGLNVCNGTKTNATANVVDCATMCDGYKVLVEKINLTSIYKVEDIDVDSCVSFFKEPFLEKLSDYWCTDCFDESSLRTVCNGNPIGESPDILRYSDMVSLLVDDYHAITEKELIENDFAEGSIETEIVCAPDYSSNAVTYINNLYNDTNIRSKFGLIKDNTEDENIRYAGKYVQNYVEFGNSGELWRIIGTFEVEKASGVTEELVKIVREESFKDSEGNVLGMSWDSSSETVNRGRGINQWGETTYSSGATYEGADLMRLLNGYYIGESNSCRYCDAWNQPTCANNCNNSIIPINSIYRNMIESVVWNTGAIESNVTLLQAYNAERGSMSGKVCTQGSVDCNDTVERKTTWEGKLGLVYPSDFGYAGENTCSEIYDCRENNWMINGESNFTLSANSYIHSPIIVWGVWNGIFTTSVESSSGVRPSLYLKSNVKIIDGDGSKSNPYKLSI